MTNDRWRQDILVSIYTLSKVDPTLRLGQGLDPMQVLLDVPPALHRAQKGLEKLQEPRKGKDSLRLPLLSPAFSDAPSSRAMAAFDPWYARRPSKQVDTLNALSAPPPPLPLQLEEPQKTIASWTRILEGILEALQLVTGQEGWLQWKVGGFA